MVVRRRRRRAAGMGVISSAAMCGREVRWDTGAEHTRVEAGQAGEGGTRTNPKVKTKCVGQWCGVAGFGVRWDRLRLAVCVAYVQERVCPAVSICCCGGIWVVLFFRGRGRWPQPWFTWAHVDLPVLVMCHQCLSHCTIAGGGGGFTSPNALPAL